MANKEEEWAKAKKLCRLGAEEIRMAKEMGLNPKSLIKNIPSKSESWKAPVKIWIRDMYEKREEKKRKKAWRKEKLLEKERKAQAEASVPENPSES